MKKSDWFLPQVRFNWGFHDATAEAQRGQVPRDMTTHFDPFYAAGYTTGLRVWNETRSRPESSELAWLEYVTTTPNAREATRYAEAKASNGYIDEATEKQVREMLRQ